MDNLIQKIKQLKQEKNAVILGDEKSQYKDELVASDVNFTLFDFPTEEMKITVKTRYKSKSVDATLIPIGNGKVKIKFSEKQKSITILSKGPKDRYVVDLWYPPEELSGKSNYHYVLDIIDHFSRFCQSYLLNTKA